MMKCGGLLLLLAVISGSSVLASAAATAAKDAGDRFGDADAWRLLSEDSLTWVNSEPRPPVPAWPDVFSSAYDVYVEIYGPSFKSSGGVYYHWPTKTFRADYLGWCLPLFDTGKIRTNSSCSFLSTGGSMYFVNHTAEKWEENDCCLFEEGLSTPHPDWMKVDHYNGTGTIGGVDCDVWWFSGTPDPAKPCYGYWSARDETKRPMQFFGLTSLNRTILAYRDFKSGVIPKDISLEMPNKKCLKKCKPPTSHGGRLLKSMPIPQTWPDWPSC